MRSAKSGAECVMVPRQCEVPAWSVATSNRGIVWLVAYAVCLHGLMLAYDIAHPEVFLNADRARSRFGVIAEFLAVVGADRDVAGFLGRHGIVGDYLPQMLIFYFSGQYGVIVFQVILLIASLAALYRMVSIATGSTSLGLAAATVYLHLPHTLVFPHQLASEAIFDPLVVISFYFLTRWVIEERRFDHAAWAGLALGLATLVRPITVLWPVLMAAPLWWLYRAFRLHVAGYVGLFLVPVLLWMGFMAQVTGEFSMGSSGHDLQHVLHNRVGVIVRQMPVDRRVEAEQRYLKSRGHGEGVMEVREYVSFAADYPRAFLEHFGRDILVFFTKSGVERIALDYVQVARESRLQLQSGAVGWRRQLESDGLIRTLQSLIRINWELLAISLVGSGVFLVFMGLACTGAVAALLSHSPGTDQLEGRIAQWALIAFPLYSVLVSSVATAVLSRHRAPAEFALAALAVIGWARVRQWGRKSAACPCATVTREL